MHRSIKTLELHKILAYILFEYTGAGAPMMQMTWFVNAGQEPLEDAPLFSTPLYFAI